MKILIVLISAYALMSLLDAHALADNIQDYSTTPYERCIAHLGGSTRVSECDVLK